MWKIESAMGRIKNGFIPNIARVQMGATNASRTIEDMCLCMVNKIQSRL